VLPAVAAGIWWHGHRKEATTHAQAAPIFAALLHNTRQKYMAKAAQRLKG